MSNRPRILVTLATYSRKDNLEPLVKEILLAVPQAEVLVIDDNSPDGTGKLADLLAAADPHIHVLHRPGKLGLGTAILAAMRFAMDRDFDWMVNMDADFSHHPRYLPGLLAGMKDHDVMIGSRYVAGGATLNWPLARQLMSKGVNLLARFLMRIPARDTSGAYRCFAVPLLRRTQLDRMVSRGYSLSGRSPVPVPPGWLPDGRNTHSFRGPPRRSLQGQPQGSGALAVSHFLARAAGVFWVGPLTAEEGR